jgi:dTDP-4-amino-4,6-dideoxygalactose transaminase
MINVFQPMLGEEELAAVAEVFAGNWIGRGSRTEEFEQAFARHIGVPAGSMVSMNSCTEATFLALELLGVGPGDEVVLPAVSFVGAANAVCARGARPVFCDVDPRTLNPTAAEIESRLTPATKAVIVLHYGGRPGDIARIARLCRERGVRLVEDAANAQASSAGGRACGTFGDIGVWSFDHGKIAVAVDGGMLHSPDPALVARARTAAYLGMEQRSGFDEAARARTRWWDFEVSSFGRRSVTNDVLAAIGTVQLRRLPGFVSRRQQITELYDTLLGHLPGVVTPPPLPADQRSSHYLYWIQVDPAIRDDAARHLYRRGVYTTFRYHPLNRVAAYGAQAPLPGAELAAESTLCLPLHQGLTDEDVRLVAAGLHEFVTRQAPRSPARRHDAEEERDAVRT